MNCTGLRNSCSTNDVDILGIIEENILDYCWSVVNVCIIFDCIPGKLNSIFNTIDNG